MKFAVALLIVLTPIHASAETGMASWYGVGKRVAEGTRFNPHAMTAAHRTLPFGTLLRVTDVASGRSVIVRVNDRGPSKRTGRIIDLSRAAASKLNMIRRGVARVQIEVIK